MISILAKESTNKLEECAEKAEPEQRYKEIFWDMKMS